MGNRAGRVKGALRRVFRTKKGKGKKATSSHAADIDSPGPAPAESNIESASTAAASSSDAIPTLDSLLEGCERRSGPVDIDEVSCTSEKTGLSIRTEMPGASANEESTHGSSSCTSPRTVGASIKSDETVRKDNTETSQHEQSPDKPPFKRSFSAPFEQNNQQGSFELPSAHSSEGIHNLVTPKRKGYTRISPTGVADLFPSADGDYDQSKNGDLLDSQTAEDHHKSRSRSFSSAETATSRRSKYVMQRNSSDSQKAREAFEALKKELEKNEFTKAVQVVKQNHSYEDRSILTAPPSLDSSGKPKQHKQQQQQQQPEQRNDDNTYEIIPNIPSVESNTATIYTEVLDDVLGITPVVSNSESLDSQGSDGSSYSSFDMDSIGEITIDSTTARLMEMHKSYCDNAYVNPNHPARSKKSCMGVASAFPIRRIKSDITIKTEAARKLTWYDEGSNLNKPFTLRTDETFDTLSVGSSRQNSFDGVQRSLEVVDRYILPLARQGIEKIMGSMICSPNEDELSLQSLQGY